MKDLTHGKPWKVLLMFAIPLVLSGLIQQLYNLADSVIVGNFAETGGGGITGENALAAVGASGTLTSLFVMLGAGGSMGCGVVISQLFGAKRFADMKTTLFTSLIFFAALSLVMSIVGSIVAVPVSRLMNTPPEVLDAAVDYLRIYMFGLPFLFLYNVCNAIFNAMGDSRKPLYFLIFSSLFNIALDYIFVAKLGWAVKGVAWATFIAQGIACVLSVAVLLKKSLAIESEGIVRAFDLTRLKAMLKIGIPSMLQMSVVAFGSIFVQALVNGFGASFIAGYSAANKIHHFMSTVVNTMGSAISTYTAQNVGAGRYDRVNGGIKSALTFMISFSLVVLAVAYLFGGKLVALFMDVPSAEAMDAGVHYLKIVCLGMAPFCLFNCFNGVSRGAGYMPAFIISTMSDLTVRVVFAYAFVDLLGKDVIALSFLIGWAVGIAISVSFHASGRWKRAREL